MKRRRSSGTVYKRKDGRFEVAIYSQTPSGMKRVRRYAKNSLEAEELLVKLRQKNNHGILSNTKEKKLDEYLDYWLSLIEFTVRPGTYKSYESTVRLYIKPKLGRKCLTKLSVMDVQGLVDGLLKIGVSHRTIQKIKIVLAAVLKRAEREELIFRNVARLVQIPRYEPKEVKPWDLIQLQTFLRCARSDRYYPIFVFLSMYGLRTSEALGLSWSDIDSSTNLIRIRRQLQYHENCYSYSDLKTSAGRRDLPMLAIVRDALQDIESNGTGPMPDLLFKTANGTPVDNANLRRSFKKIINRAGLPSTTLHHLRHAAATNLKNLGTPAKDTQSILGHAHITTTLQIYQHTDIKYKEKALMDYERQIMKNMPLSRQS